jgi:hypothetical protein
MGLADWAAPTALPTAEAPLDGSPSSLPTLTPVNAATSHPAKTRAGLFAFLIRLAGGGVAPLKA